MENNTALEQRIWDVACIIHQKYAYKDLPHNAHEIWHLAGDCLKCLIIPFDGHPLAHELMHCMVTFYCDAWKEANKLSEAV